MRPDGLMARHRTRSGRIHLAGHLLPGFRRAGRLRPGRRPGRLHRHVLRERPGLRQRRPGPGQGRPVRRHFDLGQGRDGQPDPQRLRGPGRVRLHGNAPGRHGRGRRVCLDRDPQRHDRLRPHLRLAVVHRPQRRTYAPSAPGSRLPARCCSHAPAKARAGRCGRRQTRAVASAPPRRPRRWDADRGRRCG